MSISITLHPRSCTCSLPWGTVLHGSGVKKKKKNQHLSLITYSLIGREEGEVEIDFDIYIFIVLSFSLSLPT